MSDHKPAIPVVVIAIANERSETGFLRNLTEEMKLIMNLLEGARQTGRCGVRILPCATKEDIINVFQDDWFRGRIWLFHYAGHAGGDELWVEDGNEGNSQLFGEGLARFLAVQEGLQLVFLNGCATGQQAELLLENNVPAVIATSRVIDDGQAIEFARTFYHSLANGAILRDAFAEAEGSMHMDQQEADMESDDEWQGVSGSLYWQGLDKRKEEKSLPWKLFLREESGAYLGLFDQTSEAMIHEVINNLQITEFLRQGRTSAVFKAEHVVLNRTVIFKITHPVAEGYDAFKKSVFDGSRGLGVLNHPNIVDAYDVGEITFRGQRRLYIVSEYIPGARALSQIDFQVPTLDSAGIKKLLNMFLGICEGVKAAHNVVFEEHGIMNENGIIHGNLRKGNILVATDDTPKLIDFMFFNVHHLDAVRLIPPPEVAHKKNKAVEQYYPPEVIREHSTVNKQTDIYSLGAMFFEILLGKTILDPPKTTRTSGEKITKQLLSRNGNFPETVGPFLRKALNPRPDHRYKRMEEMIDDLKEVIASIESGSQKPAPASSVSPEQKVAKA